jgi:hypothetical protein
MRVITFLFPIHTRTLPGLFLRISSCHDTRVSINAPREFQTAALGYKYFLFFLEIARDCRKTSTWVTYGNVQMQAMRMRRKEYVVQIKKHRESRTLRGKRTFTDLTWRHARVRPFSVCNMATLE